jgi:isopentenyl diphosphate isomerase/L-lactate dehydrogenase-like FMN-dependent dehydrogenase
VSNHGGHTLQRFKGTIDTLPEIADRTNGQLEIYVDGGIRNGTDVLMALALGARAVLIGRAAFWGLNLGGEEGLSAVLDILRSELLTATGLCGVGDVTRVDRRLVERAAERSRVGEGVRSR